MPAVTVFLFVVFRLLNIDVVMIIAFQKAHKRDVIVEQFNEDDNKVMIFVMTYAVRVIELNL